MSRLKTILAGVDFGGAGSDAAMWSAMYLNPDRVVLGHVVRAPRSPSFLGLKPEADEELAETLLEGGRHRVAALASELAEDLGVPFEGIARAGDSIAGTLDELADEIDADMIALGPHDRRKGGWNPLGTIPFRVLHEAKRPTLIARGSISREPERVLAAVDDSAISAHVLDWLGWATGELDAEGIVLHVIDYPVRDFSRRIDRPTGRMPRETELEEQASEWLRERLVDAGLGESCDVRVALGETELEILAAIRRLDIDLLIMGTRGAGAVGRFFLGSVAQAVASKAACPVLLLPAES